MKNKSTKKVPTSPFIETGKISTKRITYQPTEYPLHFRGNTFYMDGPDIDVNFQYVSFSLNLVDLAVKHKLNSSQLLFLMRILTRIKKDTGKVHLKSSDLAIELNKSEQSIVSYKKLFERIELIKPVRGRGSANMFYVNPFYMFSGNRIKYFKQFKNVLLEPLPAFTIYN